MTLLNSIADWYLLVTLRDSSDKNDLASPRTMDGLKRLFTSDVKVSLKNHLRLLMKNWIWILPCKGISKRSS